MDSSDDAVPDAIPAAPEPAPPRGFRQVAGITVLVFFPIAWLGLGPLIALVATAGLLGFLWVLLYGR